MFFPIIQLEEIIKFQTGTLGSYIGKREHKRYINKNKINKNKKNNISVSHTHIHLLLQVGKRTWSQAFKWLSTENIPN